MNTSIPYIRIESLKRHCLLIALWLLSIPFGYAQAPLSEKTRISNKKSDTTYIKGLYDKAWKVRRTKPDTAIYLLKKGIALSKAENYMYGYAVHLLGMGTLIGQQGNPELGITYLKHARPLCVTLERPDIWMKYYSCGSYLYSNLGYQDTALQYGYLLIDMCEKFPQWDSASIYSEKAYGYIAIINLEDSHLEDPQNIAVSISFFNKAIAIAESNGPRKENLAYWYTCLADTYSRGNASAPCNIEDKKKALVYLFKALQLAQEPDALSVLSRIYLVLGTTYTNLNLFDSAAHYLSKIEKIPNNVVGYGTRTMAYLTLGIGFYKQQNYAQAASYYTLARDLAQKYNDRQKMQTIALRQYDLYRSTGRYKEAMEHLETYTEIRNGFLNEAKIKATRQMEAKYRLAEKNRTLAQKELNLIRQKNALQEKNIWIGVGVLSSLLLSGLLFLSRRNGQQRRQLQAKQIHFMEQEQELWKQGENIRNLNAMIRGEEQERARLGRELHDGIVSELVAIKMNFNNLRLKYPFPEAEWEYNKALQHLDDTARELRKTAQNLMPDILIERGLRLSLETYCERTTAFTGLHIEFVCEDPLPRLPLDFEVSLYRMVQELVLNILKHAQASSALVQLNYHSQLMMLTIEDNGIGINSTQKGSTGIGLSNLKTRVEALQGHFDIRTRKYGGTAVSIEFDLSRLESIIYNEDKNSYC